MPQELDQWAEQIRAGKVRALSRAITAIENREPLGDELVERLFPHTGKAFVVGVTGAPGTGKSTLVDALAHSYRARGATVGIIAVDPSSPYSGGAILGDRIRMQTHSGDSGVFIRSMATRGFLGGLANATSDAALLLDAAGKQIIFIETVGVGQDEIDVVRLTDCTVVVLTPGLGDDVQIMKAGLMEVADIFAINKAERDGADRLQQEIEAMLHLVPTQGGAATPVVRTTATNGSGVETLAAAIEDCRESGQARGRGSKQQELWRRRLIVLLGERLIERVLASAAGEQLVDSLAGEVAKRAKTPNAAVQELLAHAKLV